MSNSTIANSSTLEKEYNIVITGVGGQGTILTSKILAHLAMNAGLDVKQSEVHGMSQRGGTVISMVRFGKKIHSPLVMKGDADLVLAFEILEGARHLDYLRKDGLSVINRETIHPSTVGAGLATYPENLEESILKLRPETLFVNASQLAIQAGNTRSANVVLLGALSRRLPFSREAWENAIKTLVPPKTLEVNLKAFSMGMELK
ncbi:MAG: indolepyruvate oxidoreductase subunit beta [Candidatus Wallbacteria bacterium HGW-Wallbacteria-1]|jgi:indolepyruvate ferredoxin oxidoreductase beta subunit|uniref:Indolepyruvate oxidoreductase subunit beta n=1 Tax=Candidatus Wallbacteria bacterium HGW-Wallbacteria-1 TaxID=2013854 RepID=A0A2N1PQZ5_9BACT|nr:MAG: indolepyruvate oxidoreductase subunit beta [Candidatus Wallbacteria bacterium HGW-Wallbacteria-1]